MIIGSSELDFEPDPKGVGHLFFTSMKKHKDKIAQIDGFTGATDTYGELLQRCIRTSLAMVAENVKPGDIITICSFNHFNSVVPFIASSFLGAISASLDPTLSIEECVHLLKQVTPKMIFVNAESLSMIKRAVEEANFKSKIVTFGQSSEYISFDNYLRPQSGEEEFRPYETPSMLENFNIYFSSGTSGLPKGICTNHYGFLCQTINISKVGYNLDLLLAYASLYWVTAATFWAICIYTGSRRLIYPYFDPSEVWYAIHQHKVSHLFLAPCQALEMYKNGRPSDVDTNSLSDLVIGGGFMSEQQVLNLRKIIPGTRVHLEYGQSEVFAFLLCFNLGKYEDIKLLEKKPTSSGKPIKGVLYKVVDPDTEEMLGPHQKGELRVKTAMQMNGYYNQTSTEAWDAEGYLKTGDVAYFDAENCFYIVDRIKEMLKFRSWHVSPALIENVLLGHPSIKSAAVVGVPHEVDGDHPMALVVLKDLPTIAALTPSEIIKYVEERVHDRQRLRGGVKFVDSIPTTPSGKIKRKEVKAMVLQAIG